MTRSSNHQKTPLRYPGGKQKLSPFILEVMTANNLVGCDYAEPYAGGAGVAIGLLLQGKVEHVHLNDSYFPIYSFWRSILKNTDEFCKKIETVPLTIDEWKRQKAILTQPKNFSQFDVGFSAFFLNRCNRSGILAGGGVIGGLEQKGEWKIDARFPRAVLAERVKAIAEKKKQISLKNWNAEQFITEYLPKLKNKTLTYCDPPYYQKAHRLYANHYNPSDHEHIATVIQTKIKQPWIVSYDNAQEILGYYSDRRSFAYELQYNAAKVCKGKELFFFSDDLKIPVNSTVPYINLALLSLPPISFCATIAPAETAASRAVSSC